MYWVRNKEVGEKEKKILQIQIKEYRLLCIDRKVLLCIDRKVLQSVLGDIRTTYFSKDSWN